MADYTLTFQNVSLPTGSGGYSVTVEEDSDSDGVTDTSEVVTLSDGVTTYETTSDAFIGHDVDVALSFDLGPPSDKTVTASSLLPVEVTPVGIQYLSGSVGTTTSSGQQAIIKPGFRTSSRIPSQGWFVKIRHPTSGRRIRPGVINPQSVEYIPGPNTLPRIRLPTRVNASWLDEEFDDNPTMQVYLDGAELPIGELVDVEHNEGETILVGEGGPELRQRVSVEYTSEERPVAATNLVQNNTTYSVVDNTTAAPSDTVDAQHPNGETELMGAITLAASDPLIFTGGGIQPAQTSFTTDSTNFTTSGTNLFSRTDLSDGTAEEIVDTGDYVEITFTPQYTIPASDVEIWVRREAGVGSPEIEISLNGVSWRPISDGAILSNLDWQDYANTTSGGSGSYTGSGGGDLTGGTQYTLRLEATTTDDGFLVDVLAPLDGRYSYTFDDTVNVDNGYLDGPEHYPPSVDAVFDAYGSAFSITDGSVSVTMNDTSNDQAIALSNDRGATYDITGSNTTSISGSFVDAGATINLKATLSHYEPSGTRNQTPRTGYDAQRLDAYDMDATIETVSLLIDQSYNESIDSVLNDVLGAQYGWTYSIENGTPTVTLDEPGSTTASRDPQISESQIRKRLKTYRRVIIQGSSLPVSGEVFNASTSFVNLTENDIQTGSEAVHDTSGTQYIRGVDYEMDYSAGQIKILSGGSMSSGTDYEIDYRHQVKGSHTVPSASGEELVRTIPGVVSDRQAEQIAYVLAEVYPGVSTPRYEGRIVVPRLDVGFDPLEGLALADLDLPSVATPLSIRGSPELTPLGLTLDLGSAPRLEESLSAIREQVSAVSDRV